MNANNKKLVENYVHAFGEKRFGALSGLLHPDLKFKGPRNTLDTATDYITAIVRLGVIIVRNDIKRIFTDGDEACVIYDFVTDTPVGIIPTVEWFTIKEGKITSIHLIFDRHRWDEVLEEIKKRNQ